jgi:uncharacterized protein (TIGR03083 family)
LSDTVFAPEDTAAAFRFAAFWWRSLVGAVEEDQWGAPGLGEWTVKELVAHGNRAFKTVVEYVEGGVKDPTPIFTAADYVRTVLGEETPHVHIAERGRQEAAAVDDVVTATDELAEAALRIVATRPGDTDVHLFVGEMELGQYLATRVMELVVHGLDLSRAIGLPTNPPPAALDITLRLLVDLASAEHTAAMINLLTGRPAALPLPNLLE